MAWNIFDLGYNIAKYLLCTFALRCILVYSYRLTLHPLSAYPGPILAAVTDWYVAIYALLKRQHLVTYHDHQRYGPVIRHGPNKLVFNTYRALHDTFNVFNCLDKDLHRVKRRMISKALSEQKMRRFEPILAGHINTFLTILLRASRAEEPVNMSDRCKRLGLEIIGKFGFGYGLNLQTEETNAFVLKGLEGGGYRNNVYIQAPGVRWMGVEFLFPALFKLRMKYLLLLKRLVKARLAEGKDAKEDLFSYLVDARDPETGTKIRMGELWSEAAFFFPAGTISHPPECWNIRFGAVPLNSRTGGDTTATTLSAAFFYLSRSPRCYDRFATEIRSKFSSGAEIQKGSLLASCTYLRAVLDECMRISPPISGTLWRELPVSERDSNTPLMVDGYAVPAGTWVGVNTYSIHHNEEYFPDPFAFKPERWLADSDDTESKSEHMHEAFAPFGLGSRSCAGKTMAFMEASLVLAKTVWYFDFERSNDPLLRDVGAGKAGRRDGRDRVHEFQLFDQLIAGHDGPYLMFKPRGYYCKDLE